MNPINNKRILDYACPPITEAIIEIRLDNTIDQKNLRKIANRLKKNHYPNLQQVDNIDLNIEQNPEGVGVKINPQPQLTNYRLTSDDQADIVVISPKSLAIGRLAPYLGWDSFYDRVNSVLKIWRSIVKTQSICRVGVRYINRIDIPLDESGKIENEDYLNFYPKDCIFLEIPMNNYLIQITKATSNPLWFATITSTQHPPALIRTISLLLDIDVFRTQEIPLNDDDLRSIIAEARELKNEIFMQCITRKAEELFS